jgi:hypothetical protein
MRSVAAPHSVSCGVSRGEAAPWCIGDVVKCGGSAGGRANSGDVTTGRRRSRSHAKTNRVNPLCILPPGAKCLAHIRHFATVIGDRRIPMRAAGVRG